MTGASLYSLRSRGPFDASPGKGYDMPDNDNGYAKDVSYLRTEIMDSEKARIDLLKYKLVIIAGLGSVGLGLSGIGPRPKVPPEYILCIIPFACVYFDLLCYHNTMRILVIGRFLNSVGYEYERYIGELSKTLIAAGEKKGAEYFFEMEDWSLRWSSAFVSLLLAGLGLYYSQCNAGVAMILTGIAGCLMSFITYSRFVSHRDRLFKISDDIDNDIIKTAG